MLLLCMLLPLHAAALHAAAFACCCLCMLLPLHAAASGRAVAMSWAAAFACSYGDASALCCCSCLCMLLLPLHAAMVMPLHVVRPLHGLMPGTLLLLMSLHATTAFACCCTCRCFATACAAVAAFVYCGCCCFRMQLQLMPRMLLKLGCKFSCCCRQPA